MCREEADSRTAQLDRQLSKQSVTVTESINRNPDAKELVTEFFRALNQARDAGTTDEKGESTKNLSHELFEDLSNKLMKLKELGNSGSLTVTGVPRGLEEIGDQLYECEDSFVASLAIVALSLAIESNPLKATLYNKRSFAHSRNSDFVSALADAEKYLKLHPDCVSGKRNKAVALGGLGRVEDTWIWCEAAISAIDQSAPSFDDHTKECVRGIYSEWYDACMERLKGKWWGTAVGGGDQQYEFMGKHSATVLITVGNAGQKRVLDGSVRVSITQNPMHMDITLNRFLPHIFRFRSDGSLEICGPGMSKDRPVNFYGPSFTTLVRVPFGCDAPPPPVYPELDSLSLYEKCVRYLEETAAIIPSTAKELANEEKQLDVHKSMVGIQRKFGQLVVDHATRLQVGSKIPGDPIKITAELQSAAGVLKEKMVQCGMLSELLVEQQKVLFDRVYTNR